MTDSFLRQAIIISFLGHTALFGMFKLSFGPKVPEAGFSRVYFWGSLLRVPDITNKYGFDIGYKSGGFKGKAEMIVLNKINRQDSLTPIEYSKPPASAVFNEEKLSFVEEPISLPLIAQRRESAIMFHPRLPYNFTLYFKDRQSAHIELSFEVISGDKRNSVLVKRRISSGNLEADLLSMRYISRYLFIQQAGFAPNKWQTVKIDLTTVND